MSVEKRDQSFRRGLRKQIHELIEDTTSSKAALIQPGSSQLLETIERGNELLGNVVHAREGALDAAWFTSASKYGLEQANRIHIAQEFNPKVFLNCIIKKYGISSGENEEEESGSSSDIDWTALGKDVFQYFTRTPTVTFMNGPLQKVEVKKIERKPRQRDEEDKNAKTVRPGEIEKQENKRDYTSAQVREVHNYLKEKLKNSESDQPVSLVDIVVDPNSFTKTAENMFHYAFLVKEGLAGIDASEDSPAVLEAKMTKPPAPNAADTLQKKQAVLKLNLDMWKKLRQNSNYDYHDGSSTTQSSSTTSSSRKRKADENGESSQAKRRK